jgi:hypothetical protein
MSKNTEKIQFAKNIINECLNNLLLESIYVDNFDKIAKLMEFNSDDDFYFVQIIKRFKDNRNDDRNSGNYHAGAWYGKTYRIRSVEELLRLKPEIIAKCEAENARAYITVNNRSEKATNQHIIKYRSQFPSHHPRHIHADDIVPAQAKYGDNWKGQRLRFFIDIDPPAAIANNPQKIQKLFANVKNIINMCGMDILGEYETPNGGLHIILPDKEHPNIKYLKQMLKSIDAKRDKYGNIVKDRHGNEIWLDKGRLATAHINFDGLVLLYANIH